MYEQLRGGFTLMSKDLSLTFMGKRTSSLLTSKLGGIVREFLYVKKTENRSHKTLDTYKQALDQFEKWLRNNNRTKITTIEIRDYIYYLTYEKIKWDDHPTSPNSVTGLSSRSINNTIRILKVLFNHLVNERILKSSPMDNVNYHKEKKDTFKIFEDDDVVKLLEAPNKRTYTGFRDRCLMLIMIDTGCRSGELSNLKVSDINFKLLQITFRAEITKTNSTRITPITPMTAKELKRLIDVLDADEDDFLWMTQFGERYYADSFAKMLRIYGKRAGITNSRVSPHTFRHYFAVKFLLLGGDSIALMRLLGHSSQSMTERYVKYTTSDLQKVHEKASPLTNLINIGTDRKRGKLRFK